MGFRGKTRGAAAAAIATLLLIAAACSDSGNNGQTASPSASIAPQQSAAQPTGSAAATTGKPDGPFGKFDPPVSFTTVREVLQDAKYPAGDSIDANVWTRAFAEELGINVSNNWVVNSEQYEQKINVSIISGDLPDVFTVDARQLQMLVDGDQIMPLDELYGKYASPLLKTALEVSDGIHLQAATFKDRLMAVPNLMAASGPDSAHLLWARSDWLTKLGLPKPATMEDVVNTALAFAERDPDGDGAKNSFGLVLNKDLFGGYGGLEGFFSGYGAYPRMWIEIAPGQLAYGSIQPEMKEPLKQLQQLYKAGAIDPEFTVYDTGKSSEAAVAGKVGMSYGAFFNAMWPLGDTQKTNPEADWGVQAIPSSTGSQALSSVPLFGPQKFYAINKNSKNPEAAFLILNFYMEKLYGENAEPAKYHSVVENDQNIGLFGLSPLQSALGDVNDTAHVKVVEALKSQDPAGLNDEQRSYYDNILKYRGGDKTFWNIWKTFGEGGVYDVLGDVKSNGWLKFNAFYGAPTETMSLKDATLKDLEMNFITKMIINEGDIDSGFDKFVSDWKSLGGDQITTEVNAWHANKM